jgi:hypothetical protein
MTRDGSQERTYVYSSNSSGLTDVLLPIRLVVACSAGSAPERGRFESSQAVNLITPWKEGSFNYIVYAGV